MGDLTNQAIELLDFSSAAQDQMNNECILFDQTMKHETMLLAAWGLLYTAVFVILVYRYFRSHPFRKNVKIFEYVLCGLTALASVTPLLQNFKAPC